MKEFHLDNIHVGVCDIDRKNININIQFQGHFFCYHCCFSFKNWYIILNLDHSNSLKYKKTINEIAFTFVSLG